MTRIVGFIRKSSLESQSKRSVEIQNLINQSTMRVKVGHKHHAVQWVKIEISGSVAKIPSVTNNRLNTIDRRRVYRYLENLIATGGNAQRHHIQEILRLTKALHPMQMKNPEHTARLVAMDHLYRSAIGENTFAFTDSSTERLFCLILLSPSMNRHDSHNIPKATCDWLQHIGIVKNDLHMDCLALKKTDWAMAGTSTDIIIYRENIIYDQVRTLVDEYSFTGEGLT